MILELTNGCTYTIPDKVALTCKHIQIGYSKLDRGSYRSRLRRRNDIFKRNEEFLKYYTYVGFECFKHHDRFNIDVELHWFIHTIEMRECQCDYD